MLVAFLVRFTFADSEWRELSAFIPMIDAVLLVCDLIIATLLFAQASVFRSRALLILASGYTFTGLIAAAHALTFPGAFSPTGLLGANVSTAGLLYAFLRAATPLAVIGYVLLKRREAGAHSQMKRPSVEISAGAGLAIVLAVAVTILVTRGQNLLPALYVNSRNMNSNVVLVVVVVLIALFVTAIAMLLRQRKSLLDLWLLAALWTWLIQLVLVPTIKGRFSAVWYCGELAGLLSHLIVMLALIAETNRIYARLAVTTAARARERDARLMSMDAVASAIAHEVKQPLAAIVTNASAALRWLNRAPSDPAMITESLNAIVSDGHRTADVIESIRAIFGKQSGDATTFSLNELVHETAALMARELAGEGVTVQLQLQDALPPIKGDRVQIQQVIVNLITNAIESLGATRDRPRRLAIHSRLLENEDVLVEITDSGVGIEADQMARIFDAFFTTKPSGTGMGLSLCRSIVEGHGGRLWASSEMQTGATFHLQFPRSEPEDR